MGDFIDAYEAEYGVPPNYHAGTAYAAMQVFEAAVNTAGSFDNEAVRNALATISLDTVIGHYKVNEQGLNSHRGLTFQIQDGKRVIIWPPEMAEGKPRLPMPAWSDR